METKGNLNWSQEENLLLMDKVQQRKHKDNLVNTVDNKVAWKVTANIIGLKIR